MVNAPLWILYTLGAASLAYLLFKAAEWIVRERWNAQQRAIEEQEKAALLRLPVRVDGRDLIFVSPREYRFLWRQAYNEEGEDALLLFYATVRMTRPLPTKPDKSRTSD